MDENNAVLLLLDTREDTDPAGATICVAIFDLKFSADGVNASEDLTLALDVFYAIRQGLQ